MSDNAKAPDPVKLVDAYDAACADYNLYVQSDKPSSARRIEAKLKRGAARAALLAEFTRLSDQSFEWEMKAKSEQAGKMAMRDIYRRRIQQLVARLAALRPAHSPLCTKCGNTGWIVSEYGGNTRMRCTEGCQEPAPSPQGAALVESVTEIIFQAMSDHPMGKQARRDESYGKALRIIELFTAPTPSETLTAPSLSQAAQAVVDAASTGSTFSEYSQQHNTTMSLVPTKLLTALEKAIATPEGEKAPVPVEEK